MIYIGKADKWFFIPTPNLKYPLFQNLLYRAEEKFGPNHHDRNQSFLVSCNKEYFSGDESSADCENEDHFWYNILLSDLGMEVACFFSL